ncbi:MAG: SDR family NAD(P)-dependent oxidoreductase [Verrucomicrobiota bacterium]
MSDTTRFIVITGCTRGLGRALVDEFTRLGHRVAGCGTNGTHIAELQRQPGPTEDFSIVNVTKPKQVLHWAEDLIARHGPPDMLIANAGYMNGHGAAWELDHEEWEKSMLINVLGVANTVRAFVPFMVLAKRGVILGFSSRAGVQGFAEIAPYCASKHALEGLLKTLALELPEGMASIPVAPGAINTDILNKHWGEARASAQPDAADWAKQAAPYLLRLGPEQNGQSVRIDGF